MRSKIILLISSFIFFIASAIYSEEIVKKPVEKEKPEPTSPAIYQPGVQTTYIDSNTQEVVEKSEVKRGKIYFYDKKGNLKKTGNIKNNTVFYDNGIVKKEKITNSKVYQYDKDGNLIGKIWVRSNEIKKILPDGNVEKLKIKIKR